MSTSSKDAALRDQLALLQQTISDLTRQLREERRHGPPSASTLEAEIAGAQQQLEAIRRRIGEAKALSKKRKREIDEWKLWFNNLGKSNTADELQQLQSEITWRAQDIAHQEQAIGVLSVEELQLQGLIEMSRLKLRAVREGVHERPLEEDPRLAGALAEKAALEKELEQPE